MNKIEQAVIYNKILGSLACAGMGDALGAATELYSIDEIKTQWGGFLNAFVLQDLSPTIPAKCMCFQKG